MLHERHLSVTTPAHDPYIAVGSLGHVPNGGHSPEAEGAVRKAAGGPAQARQEVKSSINTAQRGQELRGSAHPDAATIAILAG